MAEEARKADDKMVLDEPILKVGTLLFESSHKYSILKTCLRFKLQ